MVALSWRTILSTRLKHVGFPRHFQAREQPCALPVPVVEQATGREIDWINDYLDYKMLRRLADTTGSDRP
jgi:hypothetical protein